MKRNEVATLLGEIRTLDNRTVTPELIDAWTSVLGYMPLEVAREAHVLARRDASINYLEPRHLIAWSKQARENLLPKPTYEPQQGSEQPKCKEHGKKILECRSCCRDLAWFAEDRNLDFTDQVTADRSRDIIHTYAQQQIYA